MDFVKEYGGKLISFVDLCYKKGWLKYAIIGTVAIGAFLLLKR